MERDREAHQPVRMCVICRRRFAKHELMRYVRPVEGEEPQADARQVLPGRGWYVCNAPECGERFRKFRGWHRKRKGVNE